MARIDNDQALLDAVARAAHEANRAYRRMIGQDEGLAWDLADPSTQACVRDGVRAVFNDYVVTPAECHERWVERMHSSGWVFGPEKNTATKTHPCLVNWYDLPNEEKAKDELFLEVVGNLRHAFLMVEGL